MHTRAPTIFDYGTPTSLYQVHTDKYCFPSNNLIRYYLLSEQKQIRSAVHYHSKLAPGLPYTDGQYNDDRLFWLTEDVHIYRIN